ncbi:MAG: LruC domain-containing protein [Bacteroidales bacterium]
MKNSKFSQQVAISALLVIALFGNSCKNDISNEIQEPVKGVAFSYENKFDMKLDLTFRDSYGKPNGSGVLVKIYPENPYDGITYRKDLLPNFTCRADINGKFSTIVPLPGHLNSFYVVVDNMLYQRLMVIKKASSYTTNVYPAGYGVIQKSPSTRASVSAAIAYTRVVANGLPISNKNFVLDTYNSSTGKPNVLETNDPASGALITRISTVLPESNPGVYNNRATNHYFDNPNQTNISVVDNANVWVTFVSEGAGVSNTMGYFYYPTNSPPSDTSHITKRLIIFPNASTSVADGGTGTLTNGNKVKLKYQDPNTGDWSDVFPGGTTISWFLVESGWGGATYDYLFANSKKHHFSLPSLNNNSNPQMILLYDGSTQKIVLGFEDTDLSNDGSSGKYTSDKDFNDVVFAVSANPITAINTDPFPRIPDPNDRDGDGEPDGTDDYPDDPDRAHNNYYPSASTFGSLSFEDNWPRQGDYDLNDLVLDYRVMYITNHVGTVKDVEFQTRVKAIGATFRNGFAWEMNTNQSNIASVSTTYSGPGPGSLLPGTVFSLDAKGFENGITPASTKAVIPFFDNAFTLFGAPFISGYVNTVEGGTYYAPVNLYKRVTFTSPVAVGSLGTLPYNPFLVVDGIRAREVHKTSNAPTSKASGYFNTYDDKSGTLGYYTGTANYPWALDVPVSTEYSTESVVISTGFQKFNSWVTSAGNTYTDWYSNKGAGYRGGSIYSKH